MIWFALVPAPWDSPFTCFLRVLQVDSKVQAVYEEKLASSLKELRDTYENQMAENRYL